MDQIQTPSRYETDIDGDRARDRREKQGELSAAFWRDPENNLCVMSVLRILRTLECEHEECTRLLERGDEIEGIEDDDLDEAIRALGRLLK